MNWPENTRFPNASLPQRTLKEQLSCHAIAEARLRVEEKSVGIVAWEISGSCGF